MIAHAYYYDGVVVAQCCANLYVGTCDYKKSLDLDAWTYSYCDHATRPPAFYPVEFDTAARAILSSDLLLNKEDINSANAEQVYKHLCRVMEE